MTSAPSARICLRNGSEASDMRETIPFYKTIRWKECRNAYMKYARGLCEECLKKGLFTPAQIVHHKIHLTPETINDPNIALNWDNLEAVCRKCHAEVHEEEYRVNSNRRRREKRYTIDSFGRVTAKG